MNSKSLFRQFSSALVWNGFFYTIYKVLSVSLTFSLFSILSTDQFSTWATSQSLIFIIILLLDCGLKKSIPRYTTLFAQNKQAHKRFICSLLVFEFLLLLLIGIPLLLRCAPFFISQKYLFILKPYFILLFISEGIIALFRLVFHAHFWQKQFNMLHTSMFFIETLWNFYYLYSVSHDPQNITFLLTNKIGASFFVILGSFIMLPFLYKKRVFTENNSLNNSFNYKKIVPQFIKHSAFMWASSLIKSVTERNILFPYITYALGAPVANLFKLSHDGALFFQRMALKTIGISDTALLAYAQENKQNSGQFKKAFYELFKKMLYLCFPLFLIGIFSVQFNTLIYENYTTYWLFIILTISYLAEVALSPFERVLETKKNYTLLWISYTPYIIGVILCAYLQLFYNASLLLSITVIQSLRLISTFLIVFLTQQNYFTKKEPR